MRCGIDFDAGFSPYRSTRLSRYNAIFKQAICQNHGGFSEHACSQLCILRTNDLAHGRVWLRGPPLKYLSNLGRCFPANFITTAFKFQLFVSLSGAELPASSLSLVRRWERDRGGSVLLVVFDHMRDRVSRFGRILCSRRIFVLIGAATYRPPANLFTLSPPKRGSI